MKTKASKSFWQTLALGMLAGMRSMSAPAVAGHILSKRTSGHLAKSPLDFMQSEKVAIILKVLAIGELVGDKLPTAPDRTEPSGLVFRCLSGSLTGAAVYKAGGNNAIKGAFWGSFFALGSTFGSFLLRKNIVKKFNFHDPVIGAAEDAIVIAVGIGLSKLA